MLKPKIGIVTTISVEQNPVIFKRNKIYVDSDYTEAIEKVNGIPFLIPVVSSDDSLDAYIDVCDGFVFSGGTDINPLFYNKDPHKKLRMVNSKLDEIGRAHV